MFGYTHEEVVGAEINALIVPERLRQEGAALSGAVTRGERVRQETIRRRRDGSELRVSILGAPIDLRGGHIGVFGIYRDVTEERAREEQLRRSERLASLGTLLGGAAHELNNPLTSLRSFVQLMQLDDRSTEDAEALQIMACEADRAAKIVSDLRVFAGEAAREPAPGARLDLNGVVHHVVRVRDYALRNADIVVSTELDEGLPAVIADRAAIEQVLLNLVVNAEQALASQPAGEEPRRLRIRTGGEHRWRSGPPHGDRQRARDGARSGAAHLRPLLHHQGARRGHGPRPEPGPPHRHRARGGHPCSRPSRERSILPGALPRRRRARSRWPGRPTSR
jgi:PAS domain S-box-containing protein